MRLEEEIHQKKFKNEYEKALINILFTGNWLNSINTRFLKKYNLSVPQYNVLRILRGQHPKPIALHNIQARMLDRMSNASRLVDKLKNREPALVERKESQDDRRRVDIWVTPQGLEMLDIIDQEFGELYQYLDRISEEEARELNRILDKLRG
ncbi:MAG: MarR family transcriptional regulator [Bacteroidia bacterium]|nr:MarR family transcriptional regulator [Bacteroidia bacterium]